MIKSIHIENFKSIENETIQFDDISMLIGENGSGKTNLIYAIDFIKKVALGPNITEAYKTFAALPSELLNKRSGNNVIKIGICLINGDETEYNLSYNFSLDSKQPRNLFISEERFETINQDKKSLIFERKGDNVISEPLVGSSGLKIDGTVAAMSVIDHPSVQKAKSILKEILLARADISTAGINQSLEQRIVKAITALRDRSEDEYKNFEIVVKKLIPTLSSLTDVSDKVFQLVGDGHNNEYQILFTEKNMEGSLSMKASSHGDLRTYFILALAFYALKNSTIIVEEIENGLHTKRAKDLIDFLEKIAYKQNKQLIVSSHNPRLIGKIPYEKLIVVERMPNAGSSYKKLKSVVNLATLEHFLEQGGEITELL